MSDYFRECLQSELQNRIKKNSRYSLRSFARAMQLDASTLSRILNGQKIPSPQTSLKLIGKLRLDPKLEKRFLNSTVEAYERTGLKKQSAELKYLRRAMRLGDNEQELSPESFAVIGDWYHYVILQLVRTENFKYDPKAVSRRLGITVKETENAVERLVRLGYLKREGETLARATPRLFLPEVKQATQAQRKRYLQMLRKSARSVRKDPAESRNHAAMTLAIDPDKLPVARKMIQQFMDELCIALESRRKRVYELQVSLFPAEQGDEA